jgi:glycosyltransferase involved in cell wall biosynthesis
MHVVFLMADNSSVPYFNWFAEESVKQGNRIKFSFIALNPERPKMLDDMKERESDCYWIRYNTENRKTGILKAIPQLYRLFKKIKPDIVHTHLFDDAVPSLIAARLAGIKLRVITKQDTAFHWYYAPKGVKFDRLNNYNATNIVAVTEECKKFIVEKEKADENKITLIHHGIPIDRLTNQSESKKSELLAKYSLQDKIVIGTVARFITWKGHKEIIDASEIVLKKYPNARFVFAGMGGDQEKALRQIIKEKKLEEYIVFTQWVDRDYMPSLYGIMDIYLHAASYEPFGFVIAEAMVNGIPVVSTKTGAALDVIDHLKNGYLSERNGEDLAKGIFYMLENNRKEIGEEGRKKATKMYSFQQMWDNYIKLYERISAKS